MHAERLNKAKKKSKHKRYTPLVKPINCELNIIYLCFLK